MPDTPPIRREMILVAILTILGAVLRFWGPGHLGLNHFDEGIYALAGMWIQSPQGVWGISPEVIAYAPPLFPFLVGVSYLMFGPSDVAAILVSQVLGVLTIPAVAWVGRRTFGPGAGSAAAALVAISGPHIAFSRMALTDSTFLLCWVLALGFGGRFLERPGILRAIPLGLMVGLAQNAKYNGYLTGGIVGMTALWGLVVPTGERRKRALAAIGYGLLAAAIALALYWPWYRFVEAQPGGYAALVKHHQSYLSGPSAWPHHWRLQTAQASALAGHLTTGLGWGAIAWTVAWIGGWACAGRSSGEPQSRWTGLRFRVGLLVGLTVLGVAANAPWWMALGVVPWLLADPRPAVRMLALAWITMAILTPFYHPYARLWLPLHSLGWMIVAGVIASIARGWSPIRATEATPRWKQLLTPRTGLVVGILLALAHETMCEPRARFVGSPIEATDGLRQACNQLERSLKASPSPVPQRLHVVARPAVIFYLAPRLDIPIQRHPDVESVAISSRQGDYLLMDWSLDSIRSLKALPFPTQRFDVLTMVNSQKYGGGTVPATTLLDLHPGRALDTGDLIDQVQGLEVLPVLPR